MESNEAQAVVFTTFKTETGFIINATQRGDTLEDAYGKLKAFIIKEKGQPYERSSGYPKKADVPTKPCPVHPTMNLKEKTGKDGRKYWSHSMGVYPNLTWCHGK